MTMSVTAIKAIENQSRFPVAFLKLENTEDHGIIFPGQINYNEVWIPWCDDALQLSQKVFIVEVNNDLRFYIWQTGPAVYYYHSPIKPLSTGQPYPGIPKQPQLVPYVAVDPKFFKPQLVPGVSTVGGNRKLIIRETLKPNALLNQYFTISLQAI